MSYACRPAYSYPLYPLEHFFDIVQGKAYDRWSTMRTGVRHTTSVEIADQRLHLFLVKMPMDFDGRMTGHHAQDSVSKLVHLPALPKDIHFIKNIEHQFPVIRAYEK